MAMMSHVLARLKRDPVADLPIAPHLEQRLRDQGHAWRDRMLTPLVTVRLFLLQILGGNIELFPKAVDGRDRSSGFSFSVDEHDAVDQVLQLRAAVQFPPA